MENVLLGKGFAIVSDLVKPVLGPASDWWLEEIN